MLLHDAVTEYLNNLEVTKRPMTLKNAKFITQEFASMFPGLKLEDVTRREITAYIAALKRKGQCDHTLSAKYTRIHAFLIYHGIERPKREKRADRPRYTEKLPECYTEEELARFFAACEDIRQLAVFKTLLMCGLRKEEHRWLTWGDLELGYTVLHVREHPPFFTPKSHECRLLPIPAALAELLQRMPRRSDWLVFPTKNQKANQHLLKECKTVARHAGLDASRFWLHKFRATYATTLLRKGLDLRTVMSLMGHAEIASTMRYLRPLEGENLRCKVNAVFG